MVPKNVTPRFLERAFSAWIVQWLSKKLPDEDIESTMLEELGDEGGGVLVSVGDAEFKVTVERS